ncbi:class I fructose-bisphosphate aldolase [Spongisporangium articulatum]|uniref:Class I fructose-bisphosphate aldolase n=1 Tax=Spongisporangium articulatum TaxID=3362603 RepID=A0ABW8AM93_9ACTN
MSAPAKDLRWSRFVAPTSGRSLIVPIDHGLTMGSVAGLSSVHEISGWLRHPAIDGVIAHKGMVDKLATHGLLQGLGVMIHLNGSTAIGEDPDTKHMVTTVENAVRLGADAVSMQVNYRPDNHGHNLSQLGRVVDEAERFGLPVLVMVYPAGPADDAPGRPMRLHRHYLRVAYELGVHAVKTAPPEHLDDLDELLDGIGEDLPILFSGGALTSDEELTHLAKVVADSQAAGLCLGRNVFQRPDPAPILDQLRALLDAAPRGGVLDVAGLEGSLQNA